MAPSSSNWLHGFIKDVPSGDTLVIASGQGLGAPEKRLTLSSLSAPKLGRRDGTTNDEPFAWASRESMRKRCIGKACTFKIDYTLDNAANRDFGSVFIEGGQVNVALQAVSQGWAKVRTGGSLQSPYAAQLKSASEAAESQKKGVWAEAKADSIRPPKSQQDFNAQEFLAQVGKGKPLAAVVDQVGNGSTLRVTLLDGLQNVTVQVCGVQAPSLGRRPAPEGESAAEVSPPQPFAQEAKHFTEVCVLSREVRVILQGVDKHSNLFGSVAYSSGTSTEALDLGEQLVQRGLAKAVEWGMAMMLSGSQKLRDAERKAKQAKAGIWHDYVVPASAGTKLSDNFSGPVVEVVSGEALWIKDSSSGVERRVLLSSIKAPRMGGRGAPSEEFAREAREFLRRRLIGKEVLVSMDYSRKVAAAHGRGPAADRVEAGEAERQLDFGTVTLPPKKGGAAKPTATNVAELLLQNGLASVVRHRTDDERSPHYEALLQAEQAGVKGAQGLHSKRNSDPSQDSRTHINDLSLPGNANKAKQHLPFLKRSKGLAVVEAVLSANRLKLYLEKEGLMLIFSPSGVRAPQKPQPAGGGRTAATGEPFWQEALAFTREACLQRDVEIEVETVDRGGSFLGTLTTKGSKACNLGLALLTRGLAKLHPNFDPSRTPGGQELATAEARARDKRLKVWEGWVAPERSSQVDDAGEKGNGLAEQQVQVQVTHMVDAALFYLQRVEEPRVKWIEEQMRDVAVGPGASGVGSLKPGELCLARFSLDQLWYRARVERALPPSTAAPAYDLFFIDYGNQERVAATAVRPISPALAAVPPQAHTASLALVKVKGLSDEIVLEAANMVTAFAGSGKVVTATILKGDLQSAQPWQVILLESPASSLAESLNAKLLSAGVARTAAPQPGQEAAFEALTEAEKSARSSHLGIWEYGDPGNDSDEDRL